MKKVLYCFILAAVMAFVVSDAYAAKKEEKAAPAAAKASWTPYWAKWKDGVKGQFPPCGTNVIQLGLDEILQATVDTYCGLNPGNYSTLINPAVWDVYSKGGDKYPDGKTGVLLLTKLGVAFTTDHFHGKPVFDVLLIADGKSAKSDAPNHGLNPRTCFKCHDSFEGVCKGYVCGNRKK